MLLEVTENSRPTDVTTIYRPDFDLATLKQQMKSVSTELKNRIETEEITLEVRDPTETALAALIINVDAFETRLDMAFNGFSRLVKGIGANLRDCEISFSSRQIAVNIEEYEPSAFKKQVQYDAANLPA